MRQLCAAPLIVAASVVQAGPGLSTAEQQVFAQQVARCWNVGALTDEARGTVVTLRFTLDRAGKPLPDSLELVGAGKDTADAVKSAYNTAKRAIIRCGAKGYKLPLEKYDEWRNTELTFNPERMSLR